MRMQKPRLKRGNDLNMECLRWRTRVTLIAWAHRAKNAANEENRKKTELQIPQAMLDSNSTRALERKTWTKDRVKGGRRADLQKRRNLDGMTAGDAEGNDAEAAGLKRPSKKRSKGYVDQSTSMSPATRRRFRLYSLTPEPLESSKDGAADDSMQDSASLGENELFQASSLQDNDPWGLAESIEVDEFKKGPSPFASDGASLAQVEYPEWACVRTGEPFTPDVKSVRRIIRNAETISSPANGCKQCKKTGRTCYEWSKVKRCASCVLMHKTTASCRGGDTVEGPDADSSADCGAKLAQSSEQMTAAAVASSSKAANVSEETLDQHAERVSLTVPRVLTIMQSAKQT
jgi:hypothetical protein